MFKVDDVINFSWSQLCLFQFDKDYYFINMNLRVFVSILNDRIKSPKDFDIIQWKAKLWRINVVGTNVTYCVQAPENNCTYNTETWRGNTSYGKLMRFYHGKLNISSDVIRLLFGYIKETVVVRIRAVKTLKFVLFWILVRLHLK